MGKGPKEGTVPSVDEYLQRAAECIDLARHTADDSKKARLLEMAEAWRALAAKLKLKTEKPSKTRIAR
jgi:hypothetical protein